jgi:hypothetical protein
MSIDGFVSAREARDFIAVTDEHARGREGSIPQKLLYASFGYDQDSLLEQVKNVVTFCSTEKTYPEAVKDAENRYAIGTVLASLKQPRLLDDLPDDEIAPPPPTPPRSPGEGRQQAEEKGK